MKFNKLVSFTLANSFMLLIFASLLSSCQKRSFAQNGLFTNWDVPSRSLASVKSPDIKLKKFHNFQDSKQILIYCSLNSSKVKTCYNDHFSKILTSYKKDSVQLSPDHILKLKERHGFQNIQSELNTIVELMEDKTIGQVEKLVEARKKFCEKNAQFYLDKCLNQYVEKDTFSVLNRFHAKFKMNGHEYLYLKNKIETQILNNLDNAKKNIESQNIKI